jgi:tetratricopeptide (TPR) repeat protein
MLHVQLCLVLLLLHAPLNAKAKVKRRAKTPNVGTQQAAAPFDESVAQGDRFMDLGQPDSAATAYTLASTLRPTDADSHRRVGGALFMANRVPEATESFRTVVDLLPGWPEGFYNLGGCLAKTERDAEAVQSFRVAAELNPAYELAHFQGGGALIRLGRGREALPMARAAVAMAPASVNNLRLLGDALAHVEMAGSGEAPERGGAADAYSRALDIARQSCAQATAAAAAAAAAAAGGEATAAATGQQWECPAAGVPAIHALHRRRAALLFQEWLRDSHAEAESTAGEGQGEAESTTAEAAAGGRGEGEGEGEGEAGEQYRARLLAGLLGPSLAPEAFLERYYERRHVLLRAGAVKSDPDADADADPDPDTASAGAAASTGRASAADAGQSPGAGGAPPVPSPSPSLERRVLSWADLEPYLRGVARLSAPASVSARAAAEAALEAGSLAEQDLSGLSDKHLVDVYEAGRMVAIAPQPPAEDCDAAGGAGAAGGAQCGGAAAGRRVDMLDVYAAFAAGRSLVVNGLQRFHLRTWRLARTLEQALGLTVNANLYITPAGRGTHGLPPHFDDHGVVVLQLEGRKRWSVWDR